MRISWRSLIKSIRLSKFNHHDRYVWPYTTFMKYTVKFGYWTATHIFNDGEMTVPPEGSLTLKKQIWDWKILCKIKHFLWKAIFGVLHTYVQLCSLGINTDMVCQQCCLEEETINHALFLCPHRLQRLPLRSSHRISNKNYPFTPQPSNTSRTWNLGTKQCLGFHLHFRYPRVHARSLSS